MMFATPAPMLAGVCLAICVAASSASNILLVWPYGTKSHVGFYGEIAHVLANRNHTVTVVSSYDFQSHPNIKQINVAIDVLSSVSNTFDLLDWTKFFAISSSTTKFCSDVLSRDSVQKLNIKEYDLMMFNIFTSECFLPIVENVEIPLLAMFPNSMTSYVTEVSGSVDFPSFVPHVGSTAKHPMTFRERIWNIFLSESVLQFMKLITNPALEKDCIQRGFCKPDVPPFIELSKRASLFFINSVRSLDIPARPYIPSVVSVGGLNCRPAKPLPKDLDVWARETGESGFIYFSLGSAMKPSDMPEEYRLILLKVFASLPMKILWKWDQDTLKGLPSNVKISKWLPQQDLLGHPNCKLFISHGGLFSSLESTYHGVPILGLPVYGDQTTNVNKLVSEGWARLVHWHELTEDFLRNEINELLTHKRYTEVVQKRSQLMRDQPISPQDAVGYWTDYVIRHKGAPHLRSPVVDMHWYKLYNVDVWAALLTLLVVALTLVGKIATFVVRFCVARVRRSSGAGAKDDKKKKN